MRRWDTPVGSFEIEQSEHGVSAVRLTNGAAAEVIPKDLATALNEHLHGRTSSLRLDLQGMTPLAQLTLAKLLEIPYGEVRPYAWVAREIGHPNAVRPVANAVAGNPIPILIPCHRVVRSDGFIGEFSLGGPETKRALLQFEGVDLERLEDLARRRVRFVADKETNTYHLPSCRKGPQLDSPTLVELRSIEEAVDAYYEPCRRCKPS